MSDERLEELSDEVRKGIPISFAEALEVVEYQEMLRQKREKEREKSFWLRFKHWFWG